MEQRVCKVCGIDITDRKQGALTCSPKCRKELSRLESVTHNVTLSAVPVTLLFKFTTNYVPINDSQDSLATKHSKVRVAKYWYDVPLGAVPVYEKDWPVMPDFMNGRQYFLWWKNEFKEKDGLPEILNVFPALENVSYVQAGDASRRWGA